MAILIRYSPALRESVSFGCSATAEACLALHCLANPEQHATHSGWITKMRDQLPLSLTSRTGEFNGGSWSLALGLIDAANFAPFALEISRLRALSEQELAQALTVTDPRPTIEGSLNIWRDFLCDLLEAFWPYFEPTWEQLSPAFIGDISLLETSFYQGKPLYEILDPLTDQISWRAKNKEIAIATFVELTLGEEEIERLSIAPTHFGQLQLRSAVARRFALYVPSPTSHAPPTPAIPSGLIESLKAFAQTTRLQMMVLMIERPRSTQELAGILHLSPPAVSRHLRRLGDAGLIQPVGRSRRGKYVEYEAVEERVLGAVTSLQELLDGGMATPPCGFPTRRRDPADS